MGLRVMSAAELERLTPAEQDAVFQASIVRDLRLVPPDFLARIRERAAEHIKANDANPTQ
jgi:hypothetical protein